jgi:serine/threonine protein kinase
MVAGNKYNGFKIDIWSTGIILYAMLCGYLPFEDKDNDILFEKILECKLDFPKYISETSKDLIEKILVTDPSKRIDIPQIKEHPFFIKGKEIFEQEFSVCQIKREDNEANDENANLNNILKDIEKELDEGKEENEIKNEEKNDNKQNDIKVEENDNEYSHHKKIKEDLQTLNLEQENIKRLNTEYEERRPYLNSNELETLDKNENNKVKTKTNSSMKKYINRKIKIKNKMKEKKNEGPFKRRDYVFLKNDLDNKKNRILNNKIKLDKSIKSSNLKNNKELIKTSKYNNIKERLNTLKKGGGKSAYLRSNNNYLNTYKNMLSKRINIINLIKNQFNSKENIKRKLKRKENIYKNNINNNINNTIDNRSLKYKKIMNGDFKFYNSSVGIPKKNHSVDKKNIKLISFETTYNKKYLENLFNISSSIKKYEKNLNSGIYRNQKVNDNERIKNKISGKSNNNSVENSMLNNCKKEKAKNPYNISRNNNPGNINIIDNTKDSDINTIESININNIKNNIGKNNPNQITPKNKNKMNEIKDKNPKKIKLKKTSNANLNKNNQENVKFNYYLNEIDKKKNFRN